VRPNLQVSEILFWSHFVVPLKSDLDVQQTHFSKLAHLASVQMLLTMLLAPNLMVETSLPESSSLLPGSISITFWENLKGLFMRSILQ
jgi:hypothetical protein